MPYWAQSSTLVGSTNNATWDILSSAVASATPTPTQYYSGFHFPTPAGTDVFSEEELISVLGDDNTPPPQASHIAIQGWEDAYSHASMSEEPLALFSAADSHEEATRQTKDESSEATRVFSSQFFG
jgi:hypothetical protein